MIRIIGLLGGIGSGKTACANYLHDKYGAKRLSFAKPLKDLLKKIFEFSDDQLWGTQEQKAAVDLRYGFSARDMMQKFGQGFRDQFGNDIWIRHLMNYVDTHSERRLFVVDDVRYENEALGIRYREGSFIWRIENPSLSTVAANHQSELEWETAEYDHLIAPAWSDLQHLYTLLDDACTKYRVHPLRRETPL